LLLGLCEARELAVGACSADGGENGQTERSADLLAGVEQGAGDTGVGPVNAGDGGGGERDKGHAHAGGDQGQGWQQDGDVGAVGLQA